MTEKLDRTGWQTLCRRTEDPKLMVIERCLDCLGVTHRRNGHSFHAPILEVPDAQGDESHSQGWELLTCKLGAPSAALGMALGGNALQDLIERHGVDMMFDDVPDDDPAFNAADDGVIWI